MEVNFLLKEIGLFLGCLVVGFATYAYCIWKNGFVIDDQEAIVKYDGKLQGKGYYHYLKYLWIKAFGKSPHRHHFFSVLLHTFCCGLLYLFLEPIVGSGLAFLTTVLWAVHPIGTQAVAWVSGKGYPLGLIGLLLALQVPKIFTYYPALDSLPLLKYIAYIGLYTWGILGQFTALVTAPVNLFLGQSVLAIISSIIAIGMGFRLVKKTILDRSTTFRSQAMGGSTYLKLRKFIVAMKTLAYYTLLCLFPVKMGIYHTYGYHYGPELETEDGMFYLGCLFALIFAGLFFFGPLPVKLGVVWFISYIIIFLNWITIHQFVSERYCYIANIGLCLILGYFLLPYPIIASFIVGLYLMRTWLHLPTYNDQVRFYQSNIWNFPKSEVAMANLGVVLMRAGQVGMAVDNWILATKVNPDYDVPYYNLYSTLKLRGDFKNARANLVKAIESEKCHFKEKWNNELSKFDREIIMNKAFIPPQAFPEELKMKVVTKNDKIMDITTPNVEPKKVEPKAIRKKVRVVDKDGNTKDVEIKEMTKKQASIVQPHPIQFIDTAGKPFYIPINVEKKVAEKKEDIPLILRAKTPKGDIKDIPLRDRPLRDEPLKNEPLGDKDESPKA